MSALCLSAVANCAGDTPEPPQTGHHAYSTRQVLSRINYEYWESQYDSLERLLDDVVDTYAVDTGRIYLTGLSMGGYGAWHWALRDPSRLAAVVPIAGGHVPGSDELPENICDLKDLPV